MGKFTGKVALVTGGASGIGFGISESLAAEGAQVVIGDIQWPLAQESADKIGKGTLAFKFDTSKPEDAESVVKFAVDKFGGVDYAVNCAGIQGPLAPLADVEPADLLKIAAVNQIGMMYLLKYEIPAMKKRGGGSIVNISSMAGSSPIPYMGAFSASKAAVNSITRAVAVEYGPDNIRVNAIEPGYTDTPLLHKAIDRNWAASITPTRRCGTPKNIADTTIFLLSDAASQVNGVIIAVDGGLGAASVVRPPGFNPEIEVK